MYPRQVPPPEEDPVAWPVTLMVHVGPHKTATTTIQAVLAHNTPYLATRGVHVPPGGHPLRGGHHLLPFLLDGLSLSPLLGLTQVDVSVGDLFDAWLTGARETGAHRVLVSSEVFDVFEEEAWRAFDRELQESALRTKTAVTRLVIHFTRREIESRVRSAAGNSYIHGATLPREELDERLRAEMARQDATIERIPTLLSTPAELSYLDFDVAVTSPDVAPTPPDFVVRWFAHVLGAEDAGGIEIAQESSRLNPSLAAVTHDGLRAFNVLNNPPHADSVSPFLRFDGNSDLERAFERLNLVRSVFFELDAKEQLARELRAEIQNLHAEIQNLRDEVAYLLDRSLRARIRRFLRGSRPRKDVGPEF